MSRDPYFVSPAQTQPPRCWGCRFEHDRAELEIAHANDDPILLCRACEQSLKVMFGPYLDTWLPGRNA